MTIQTQENSVRYHLYMVGVILLERLFTAVYENRKLLIGVGIGFVLGIAVLLPSVLVVPIQTSYNQLTPTAPVQLSNTDVEIVDTELVSGIGGQQTTPVVLNFTGRMIATNEPVNTFECSFNSEEYKDCVSPFTIGKLESGNYTFEVRSILANGTKDPTPAAWIGSVE